VRIDHARQTNPLWHELKQHYEERLEKLRVQNDNAALDAIQTAALRARIAEIKTFISLDTELPIQEKD
jgi:hypothetical protein